MAAAGALAIATALAFAGGAIGAPPPQFVGINAAVLNSVRIRHQGAPMPFPAQLRQRVALADEVQTGVRSQLQILLLDKSVFTVGANARLTIDRFVYDPNRGSGSFAASVAKGAFRFMSGRPHTSGGSSVRTPTASIGIRGTVFEGVVGEDAVRIAQGEPGVGRDAGGDPGTASLIVLRGPGRATQGKTAPGAIDVTAGGRTVTLDRPMLASYVPYPGAAPIGPFVISRAGLQRLQALIFPSLAEQLGFAEPEAQLAEPDGSNPFAQMPPPREPRGPPPPGFFNPNGPGFNGPDQGPPNAGGYVPNLPGGVLQPGARGAPTRPAPNQPTTNVPNQPAGKQPTPAPTPTPTPPPTKLGPVTAAPAPTPTPTPKPTVNGSPSLAPPPGMLKAAPQPTPTPSPTPTPKPTYKAPSLSAGPNSQPPPPR